MRPYRFYKDDEPDFDDDIKEIRPLFEKWTSQMERRTGLPQTMFYESHRLFLDFDKHFYHQKIVDYSKYTIIGDIMGLLCFSRISDSCLGFNALINDFSYRNLYRWMMHEGVRIAKTKGFRYLNIQGSEDADQYQSKQRFKAEIEIPKKHLVLKT